MRRRSRWQASPLRGACAGAAVALWVGSSFASSMASRIAPSASASDCDSTKILAADGKAGDVFGHSVAIDGDVAVAGALCTADAGPGSAYIYRFDGVGWEQEAKLFDKDGESVDQFGWDVFVSGDLVIIGARFDDDKRGVDVGSASLYRYDGKSWSLEMKLLSSDGEDADWFGTSVATDGQRAITGAVLDDDRGFNSGSAYVFAFDGEMWHEEAKLTASNGAAGDRYGRSVAILGDVAVVGSYLYDGFRGAVYVYRFVGDAWAQEAFLFDADGEGVDQFGFSVAVADGVIVVGVPGDDDNASNAGSAHVYRFDGKAWSHEVKLFASDPGVRASFGTSVSIDGEAIAVGASQDDGNGDESGAAYVFRYDGKTWVETTKLIASDGDPGDHYGNDVAISGDRLLAGVLRDDDRGTNAGAAYVTDVSSTCICPADLDGDGDVGFEDLIAVLAAWGNTGGPEDLDEDGLVGFEDIVYLLARWGPC